ncbi:hypothetical protein I546_6804 [Mycobacterium kansasii 732]|nr:hypothetical protein I546_6804 [Mycobacterium kansasii 732]
MGPFAFYLIAGYCRSDSVHPANAPDDRMRADYSAEAAPRIVDGPPA